MSCVFACNAVDCVAKDARATKKGNAGARQFCRHDASM